MPTNSTNTTNTDPTSTNNNNSTSNTAVGATGGGHNGQLIPLPYVNRGCVYGITGHGTPLAVVLLGQVIALDTVALLERVVEKHFTNRGAQNY